MELRERIRDFVIETFLFGTDNKSIENDESFLESGIIDSTGVLELVSFIEENFGIEVKDEELIPDNFDSLDKLYNYISKKSEG